MPLAGAVICCTTIPPELRTELGAIGAQMGATIKLDLTSDVTHLIVGTINSAKYRYVAKAREDVKVLRVDWLKAVCSVWMEGGDVDVAALEAEYRLPAFHGLKICLTGFEDPEQRKHIQDTVSQHGAEYHGDLTKAVTHLIAAAPIGRKYEHATSWQLKVVAWEWFEQSLARGMALDEQYFHPTLPVEERGQGAWDRQQSTSPMLGKRVREIGNEAANPLRRKLRRSASTKLGSQSEALWAGIMTGTSEQKKNEDDDWTDTSIISRQENHASAQANDVTHAAAKLDADPASLVRGPFVDEGDGIFAGRIVFPHGFDRKKTNILCEHMDGNGAEVIRDAVQLEKVSSDDLRRGYLVVPHDVPVDPAAAPEGAGNLTLVTNWWVERCIHGKRLVDPSENVLCRPFDQLSISGFHDLCINLTGFTGIELLQVTKAVALFGATNDDFLSPKISVMICNNRKPNPDKFKYATDKRIPAVHATWLWDSISSGHVQPYDDYLLNTIACPQQPKQKPRASLPAAPTAPLSTEDSLEIQKKMQLSKSTKSRDGLKRVGGTLELSISNPPTPVSTTPTNTNDTNESSLEHDVQLPLMCDGSGSLPLRDINPNSPRRPSSTSSVSNLKSAPIQRKQGRARQPSPDSVIPADTDSINIPVDDELEATTIKSAPPLETDYSDMMSKLLASRTTLNSAANEEESGRRKRPLGRAQSARSELSTTEERDPSSKGAPPPLPDDPAVSVSRSGIKVLQLPQPSQELGWDSPGAMEAREKMIRAVGGKVEGRTAGPVGVVMDKVEVGRSLRRKKA